MADFQDPTKKAVLVKFDGVPTIAEAIKICDNVLFAPTLKKTVCKAVGDGNGMKTETTVSKDATVKATIKSDVRTPSAAGSLPVIDDLWQMAGLTPTADATAHTVTYVQSAILPALGHIIDYTDGEKRDITKVRADFSLEFKQGEAVMVNFDIFGQMSVAPTVEANPAGIVLDTGRKYFVDCISVNSFDGGNIHLESATFKSGNAITDTALKGSEEAGGECERYKVGERLPTLEIGDTKEKGVVQHWSDITDGTKRAFSVEMTDYVTLQKFKLEISEMTYEDVTESVKDVSRVGVVRKFNVDSFKIIYS